MGGKESNQTNKQTGSIPMDPKHNVTKGLHCIFLIQEMTNHSEDLEKALREQTQAHDCEIEELNRRLAEIEEEKTAMKKEYADEVSIGDDA